MGDVDAADLYESPRAKRNAVSFILSLTRERGTRGSLVRGSFGSFALLVSRNVLQFGVSVLLARILEPSGYGKYAFAMSLVSIIGLGVLFGLPGLITREVAAGEAREDCAAVSGLLRRAYQLVLLALLIALSVGIAAVWVWPGITTGFRRTFSFALLFMAFNVFSQLRAAELQGLRRVLIGQVGLLGVQPGAILLGVAGAVFGFRWAFTPDRPFAIAAGAALVALIFHIGWVPPFLPAALARARHRYHTRPGWRSACRFAAMTGLALITAQTDIVMLGFMTKSSEVGLYRVAATGAILVAMVLTAINPVIGPTLARLYALQDHARLKQTARIGALVTALCAAPLVLVYIFACKSIFGLAFVHAYVAAWLPLVILSVGQFINASVGSVGLLLNMTGHERDTVWVLGGTALLNIVLNAVLIPYFGMTGAAVSTAISMATWNLMMTLRVKRRLGFFVTPFFR